LIQLIGHSAAKNWFIILLAGKSACRIILVEDFS
jgi:hypothetical protein